jgi:hypothetical protein
MSEYQRAPFPWFGGKSKAAELIWSRLGHDIGSYVEPFLGSCAVYLNRPAEFDGWVTLNDLDGNAANFWRSIQNAPDEAALAAANPVFEVDLHARHLALVSGAAQHAERMMADADYHDPKLAGWWAWGACVWIGGGWCAGDGPWRAEPDADGVPSFTLGNGGKGVNRKLPHLGDGGKGVNRKLPHLGNGTGVNRKLERAREWFGVLQSSLEGARIACGDWERICSPGTMTRNGICGVLLDPPYSLTDAVYAQDSSSVSGDVRRWCIANGNDPLLRIALCGHDTEHNELEALGWTVETWAKGGGYQGADDRERIWFSPACIGSQKEADLFA